MGKLFRKQHTSISNWSVAVRTAIGMDTLVTTQDFFNAQPFVRTFVRMWSRLSRPLCCGKLCQPCHYSKRSITHHHL
ncbi:hypothetical protein BV326_05737 [Pseudomonas syringae pv. actinidiae]|nr:hypothetical protein BV326_05737 [Pseudomonas syringae pv. actinidiae]